MKDLKKIRNLQGFTLVELLVVITILAILGTIGFMSFNGYQSSARDGVRVSDIKNAETGLEVYAIKSGYYPTPDDFISYTGGTSEIKQGFLGDSVTRSVNINKTPLDPKSNERYTYSTSGNGKYYQILATKENLSSSHLIPLVYADALSVMIRGNYRMDPSLPSLLVVSGSANTNSGIFDPNVCFIVDGGKNTLNNCVEKKYEMSLKDYDSSLVGYWDMETTSGTLLKDLSGNGNDGSFSGGMIYNNSLTGGIIGKGLYFNGDLNHIKILNSELINPGEITIQVVMESFGTGVKTNSFPRILSKGSNGGTGEEYALWLNYIGESSYLSQYRLNTENNILSGGGIEEKYFNIKNKKLYITFSYNLKGISKYYVNGILLGVDEKSFKGKILPSTYDLIIGHSGWTFGLTRAFYGIIDDMKIYNRALSDEEIRQQAKMAGF